LDFGFGAKCGAAHFVHLLLKPLVRPEYYETDDEAKQELSGVAELIIAKQRNGPTGEVPLTFLKQFTRFESRADMRESS
jgi:replicative DNA helicase